MFCGCLRSVSGLVTFVSASKTHLASLPRRLCCDALLCWPLQNPLAVSASGAVTRAHSDAPASMDSGGPPLSSKSEYVDAPGLRIPSSVPPVIVQ